MKRLHVAVSDALDQRLEAEGRRRGVPKAALIRDAIAHYLGLTAAEPSDPWTALTGWLDDEPVDHLDEVIYGGQSARLA